mmetsp:Transcript_5639/g.7875  ORF Transcript_5639/g.7875 Transcript_5639/m.7875 type:complete len:505 (-) Transcript_5639:102-1616(-)|eukprot:CAMPEP_0194033996 /NCGR_PEP_ID=MMETSP0009_2-20130614/6436_1 /TAXON_ID=210454 /ORGANISM="Grammatophora oceanica, Strain CCMP 410" /LENGTH=504 /DNA_ID=CAMNT_0038674731 /DNA_START=249 /DNA_END=1763 /DNA_ORIENTATION=-
MPSLFSTQRNFDPNPRYKNNVLGGDEQENALYKRGDDEKFCDDDLIDDDGTAYPDTIDDIKARRRRHIQFIVAMTMLFLVVSIPLIVTKVGLRSETVRPSGTVVEGDDDYFISGGGGAGSTSSLSEEELVNVLSEFDIPEQRSLLQELAFDWVKADRALASYTKARIAHRFALACFYYATYEVDTIKSPDAPKWAQKHNWMSVQHECDWFGITCDQPAGTTGNLVIKKMELSNNNITGRIPTELGLLHNTLQVLELNNNQLYMNEKEGHFKVLKKLTNLQELHLHDNFLVSNQGTPYEVAFLNKLMSLDLSFNLIEGYMHLEHFHNLTELQHLQLQGNYLTGHMLPKQVARMTNLVSLDVRDNNLDTGLNFLKFGNELSNLSKVWMENNSFYGTIPPQIHTMKALTSLSLMNGTLTGTIPSEIGMLTNLEHLWLGGNSLEGSIPAELNQLTHLEVLELQWNDDLSGEVPLRLCQSLNESTYEHKRFTADCESRDVTCECCTQCF